jgi:signal transduction histidine kinase
VRRRLTLAMTLVVVGALLLSGLFTLVVSVHNARVQTRNTLRSQAVALASSVVAGAETGPRTTSPEARLRVLLRLLKAPLRLDGAAVLVVTPDDRFVDLLAPNKPAAIPSGLKAASLDPAALLGGKVVSGTRRALVWAAAPFALPGTAANVSAGLAGYRGGRPAITEAVILTRSPPTGLAAGGPWFVAASVVVIALTLLVADRLGRRIVRPLEATRRVTERIAGGDLAARVPHPPGTDPELAALASSVNAMAESLARAKSTERQFLMSVSHDLRTPLTSIRGFAEAIAEGATDDTRKAAGVIGAEARRLQRLVADLLDLARMGAGQFSLAPRPVEVGELVATVADGFEYRAAELDLALVRTGAAGRDEPAATGADAAAVMAWADPERLAQVVGNLVENALSFARRRVEVGAHGDDVAPIIWVADDGAGIPPGDLGRVFEPLYSSRRPPGRQVGSGLGLTIVAELTTAMGGTVRVESPCGPDGGTRVVVVLPPAP